MKQTKRHQLVYPGPAGWMTLVTDQSGGGKPAGPVTTEIESPTAAIPSISTDLALPASALVAVPIWLQGEDEAAFPEMVPLQLERRGLRLGSEPVRWKRIAVAEGRTLVLAITFATPVDPVLELDHAEIFEPNATLLPFPADHLILFKELGSVVAAYTRGEKLAWLQVLGGSELDGETLMELRCLLLQLGAEDVLAPIKGVLCFFPILPDAEASLSKMTGVGVSTAAQPAPRQLQKDLDLVPPAVVDARVRASRAGQIRKILGIAAMVYLLAIAGVATFLGIRYAKIAALQRDVKANAPELAETKTTAERWKALEAAIQPSLYPLEQLYRAAKLLPPDGVRFTVVEQRPGSMLIRGEARNAPAAYKLFEDIRNSKDWAGYTWQMPQPKLLPNGSAQFQLEGSRGATTAQR